MNTDEITTTYVAADLLRRNPHNRQPTDAAVTEMMESIRELGVLQPITARPVPGEEGNDLEIVMGERRWEACRRIRPDYPVPVMIRELDEKQAARLMAVENFQRKDLDPIEEARAIEHMRETGWTMREISEAVGRGVRMVHTTLKLLDLPPEGIAAIKESSMTIAVGAKIAALPEDLQARAVKDCVEPVASAYALSEREALAMLAERYFEPLKAREAWQSSRGKVENEWPTAKWLEYEDARALCEATSGWESVLNTPAGWLLSSIYTGEVPKWLELAKRHGAEIRIGCSKAGEALAMVEVEPLVDAEKAAHADAPEDCCFRMVRAEESPATAEAREERAQKVAESRAKHEQWIQTMRGEKLALARAAMEGELIHPHLIGTLDSLLDPYFEEWEMASVVLGLQEPVEESAGLMEELRKLPEGQSFEERLGRFLLAMELTYWEVDAEKFRREMAGLAEKGLLSAVEVCPALAAHFGEEVAR